MRDGESNKGLERGAGESALLFPRSDSRRRRPRWSGSGRVEQLVKEGDRSASVGDPQGAVVEVVAQGVEVGLGERTKVGALGIATAVQPVELFDAALVAGPKRVSDEHGLRAPQRCGDGVVPGKIAAIVEGERTKGLGEE